jgi:catechol 2,3-dioxygenase-like lactoylglutathione lyase family enzyme
VWDHVAVVVSDLDAARRFYGLAFETLGYDDGYHGRAESEWEDFCFGVRDERPVSRGLHVGFLANSRDAVDAWWRTMTEAGYESDGEPGPRPQYSPAYYGAFVLDPDGNSVEAVHHGEQRDGEGHIDHIWVRVADLAATKRFYETIAPAVGIRVFGEQPGRFHIAGGSRSSGFVHDGRLRSENLHLAFGVDDNASVDEFHRVAVAAGYEDNGPPGERPVYHEGYYGAFVFDPDGHNVEAVCHNR